MGRGARIVVVAALTALSLVTLTMLAFLVVTQKYATASTSMSPTVNIGDWTMFFPLWLAGEPETGDIVTFRRQESIWVKRVVASAGDRISVSKGVLKINGTPASLRTAEWPVGIERPDGAIGTVFEETLPSGRSHLIVDDPKSGILDNTAEVVVPDGHYFLVGDNRDNSYDSRSDTIGMIPRAAITARNPMIYFAYDSTGIRFDRIGTWLR